MTYLTDGLVVTTVTAVQTVALKQNFNALNVSIVHCIVWAFTCRDTLAASHLNRTVLSPEQWRTLKKNGSWRSIARSASVAGAWRLKTLEHLVKRRPSSLAILVSELRLWQLNRSWRLSMQLLVWLPAWVCIQRGSAALLCSKVRNCSGATGTGRTFYICGWKNRAAYWNGLLSLKLRLYLCVL